MKKIVILLVLSAGFVQTSCNKRLDDFLFNPSQIDEYKLDDFDGPVSLDLQGDYFVPQSMIHKFSFPIEYEGEILNIHAIYTGNLNSISTDTVILYCHGNRDHMDFYWPRQKIYSHLGNIARFGVLMIDYPGYGLSDGKTTEENMYASVDGALQWLKTQGLTDDRLVMFGFSLGSAPVCKVAGEQNFAMNPSKIILEAPFASAEKMIQDAALLAMPSSYFVNVKIENAEQIKNVGVPFLWIHGEADDFLEISKHGKVVYENYEGLSKTKVIVPGGGHESTPAILGFENYSSALLEFITKE
jgi:pimeloyl-ACP methyl ester carboxylesterase